MAAEKTIIKKWCYNNFMEQYIKANMIKADLVEVDKQLSKSGAFKDMTSMLLIKHSLISIANFVDFELTIRHIYKDNPELSIEYKKLFTEYDFAKYLRNKFVGHIKQELIEKAIEWKPELRYSLNRVDEDDIMFIFNIFILETAINTYVDVNGKHKYFDSDTDLVYPPDNKRFLIFLSTTIRSAIEYLSDLSSVLSKDIVMLNKDKQQMEHWIAAAKTEFKYIKK